MRGGSPRLGFFTDFKNRKYFKVEGFFLTGIPDDLDGEDLNGDFSIAPRDLGREMLADTFPESLDELEIICDGFAIHGHMAWEDLVGPEELPVERDVTHLLPFLTGVARNCLEKKLPNLLTLRLTTHHSRRREYFDPIESIMENADFNVEHHGFVEDDDDDESNEEALETDGLDMDAKESVETDIGEAVYGQEAHHVLPAQRLPSAPQLPSALPGSPSSTDRLPDILLVKISNYFDLFDFVGEPFDEFSMSIRL